MTTMNGHARDEAPTAPVMVPFSMQAGPRSGWPSSPQPEPVARTAERTEAAPRRDINGDKLRRAAMWILASGVAAIAAIVSYSHIYDLGRVHGGTGVPARLLPLSVDMLIVAGELMLLHEADAKGRRFALGWVLVWSGILATLAANVTYGTQFGVVGALIWGWPAYSFILAAGGMVSIVKRAATREDVPSASAATQDVPDSGSGSDMKDGIGDPGERHGSDEFSDTGDGESDRGERQDSGADSGKPEPPRPPRQRQESSPAGDKVTTSLRRSKRLRDLLASDSAADRKAAKDELAEKAGVSVRTVERIIRESAGSEA